MVARDNGDDGRDGNWWQLLALAEMVVGGDQKRYQRWWTKVADDGVTKVLVAGDGS